MQAEATQVAPDWQALLQSPQFARSLVMSTHAPEQSFVGAAQAQVPLWQVSPFEHEIPQVPQSLLFVCVSTQAPTQFVRGCVQVAAHAPALQT